jgi:alpha-glucuronidase
MNWGKTLKSGHILENNLFISNFMVSDRFGEILQKWQKLKEKIHTTKDR